jgi:hypothetical protein
MSSNRSPGWAAPYSSCGWSKLAEGLPEGNLAKGEALHLSRSTRIFPAKKSQMHEKSAPSVDKGETNDT